MSKYNEYEYMEIYNNNVLGEETLEDKINQLRKRKVKYKYMVKTIQSGDYLESEVYPVYANRKDVPRGKKTKKTRTEQRNLNDKNALKYFIRLVNTNFGKDDLELTLTYEDKYLPTHERAKKDIKNYIERLRRYRRKNGLPELKYIYVMEHEDEPQHGNKKIRVHYHILINNMDRDVAEKLWGKGRVNSQRLQPDEFGLEGKARYMAKAPKGKKWYSSRNLKKPKLFKSISRLSNRKAEELAKSLDKDKIFEKMYKEKYKYNDCEIYYSDFTGGFYLYIRMRRRK